jgi:hypothetical protein
MKAGSGNYLALINANVPLNDTTFPTNEVIYWGDYSKGYLMAIAGKV